MSRTTFAPLLLASSLVLALPAAAEEDPPYDVEQEELKGDAPPFKLERPSDSWLFIKLDVLKEQVQKQGGDTSGFTNLKGRLWWGAAKANLFLYAYPDRGDAELEAQAKGRLERIKQNLLEPQVKSFKAARIGKRPAFVFEIEGKPPRVGADPVVLLVAMASRPEDKQMFEVIMEVAGNGRVEEAKKDFSKLLKQKLKI
jgi:hypothetical protein